MENVVKILMTLWWLSLAASDLREKSTTYCCLRHLTSNTWFQIVGAAATIATKCYTNPTNWTIQQYNLNCWHLNYLAIYIIWLVLLSQYRPMSTLANIYTVATTKLPFFLTFLYYFLGRKGSPLRSEALLPVEGNGDNSASPSPVSPRKKMQIRPDKFNLLLFR